MDRADVLILGGGLVGSALAVALDAHGITSIVVDLADPEKILAAAHDGRASAIASAPYRMFEAIGVADRLDGRGCPLKAECLAGAIERAEPWGVWGGEIFERGAIVPRKRPRGRPRKEDLARDVVLRVEVANRTNALLGAEGLKVA